MNVNIYNVLLDEDKKNILVKEKSIKYEQLERANTTDKIVRIMNDVFEVYRQPEEHNYLICFNGDFVPIAFFDVSHGVANLAPLGVREIMTRVCLIGAVGIALLHNHPAGNNNPSNSDVCATKKLIEACNIMDVEFYDDIIISGKESFYSFYRSMPELFTNEIETINKKYGGRNKS